MLLLEKPQIFIKLKMEQQNLALTRFKKMVQRVVNVEAKTDLISSIIVWDADFRCSTSYCLSQKPSTKMQIQSLTAKESKPKEFRPKDSKLAKEKISALPYNNESRKTFRLNNKKKYLNKKRDQKNSTSTIRNNAIKGEKKRNN